MFAEFLNHSSPDRLGILYLPTCVGLGYGRRASSLAAFLGSMGSVTSPERLGITSQTYGADSLVPVLHAYPRTTIAWADLPAASPHRLRPPSGSVRLRRDSPQQLRICIGAGTAVLEYQPVVHRLRLSASS